VENRRNLLVTLADKNYIQQAKQLFSSVYWNAGWEGDYLLLAHEIPDEELQWFTDKGILIKKCNPLRNKVNELDQTVFENESGGFINIVLDKFYVFSSEFKKWKSIIFIDSDIIVRGSLERLTKIRGFGAVDSTTKLSRQFSVEINLHNEIKTKYIAHKKSFNTGLFVLSTDIIHEDTLYKLIGLYDKYENIALFNEEAILNLFFYKNWVKIPRVFNLYISVFILRKIRIYKTPAIILHFIKLINYERIRPWYPENPFYSEWISNLERAEFIDLNRIPEGKKWKSLKIYYYSLVNNFLIFYVNHIDESVQNIRKDIKKTRINIVKYPDRMIGLTGILIKKLSPRLYYKIKGKYLKNRN
jgi:lipopolysaccharide biosynthesis glycosyltransferase